MYQTNVYIGLNDKETKTQLIETQQACDIIIKTFKGYDMSMTQCMGVYTYEDGSQKPETSYNVMLISEQPFTDKCQQAWINKLCRELNQESVMITEQELKVKFLKGE